MPISMSAAHAANTRPSAFKRCRPGPAPAGNGSKAPIITALLATNTTQPNMIVHAGSRELTIHQAVASSKMPKPHLMPSIHAPAFGSKAPDEAPNNNNGMPEPHANANSAEPPKTTSPVCEINSSTPASGAATQGPTIRAESIPIRNTPP